jgi:trk system potassium uptake protein TrkA
MTVRSLLQRGHEVVIIEKDKELDHICIELGLTETIIPVITIDRRLADIVEGQDIKSWY